MVLVKVGKFKIEIQKGREEEEGGQNTILRLDEETHLHTQVHEYLIISY